VQLHPHIEPRSFERYNLGREWLPTVGLVDMIRVEDGLIAEQWGGPDLYDLIRQLDSPV
jgi:hypothetical protein